MRAAAPASRSAAGVTIAAAALLVGPVALSFWSGGYFEGPRLVALASIAGILLVLALVVPGRALVPRTGGGAAALAGLLLLAGWVALSRGRSTLPDVAGQDAERVLLYAAVLVAGSVTWRSRRLARTVEPAVVLGILAVVGFGLLGRWLPGIVELTATDSAGGRLEQPLTYWNAMGLIAAVGIVLALRMATDFSRAADVRAAAAAAVVPLACGLYLSFSRGALAALVAGLIVLAVCSPSRAQLQIALGVVVAAVIAVAVSGALPGVRALEGAAGSREREGLVALAVSLLCAGAAAVWADRVARRRADRGGPGRVLPRGIRWVAASLVVLTVLVPVLAARGSGAGRPVGAAQPSFGASNSRLSSLDSNRYAYWRVAVASFRAHPVDGVGSGSFKSEWLRERRIDDPAKDAHSIVLETLAELGLVGFALLLAAIGGVATCAARVQRQDPALAAGSCAALTVWLVHASLDWDWEMPGVTLPALTLAGMLVARAGAGDPGAEVRG